MEAQPLLTAVMRAAAMVALIACAPALAGDFFEKDGAAIRGYDPVAFSGQVSVSRHHGAANYLILDGHVERLAWKAVKPGLHRPGSRFVNPAGHQSALPEISP